MRLDEAQDLHRSTFDPHEETPWALLFAHLPWAPEPEALAFVAALPEGEHWTPYVDVDPRHASVRDALIARVRALPVGRERVEGLCSLAPFLDEGLLREGLQGLLEGVAPGFDWIGGKPVSHRSFHARLLRRLGPADKERWIAGSPDGDDEALRRNAIDAWTDEAARRLYAALWTPAPEHFPSRLLWIASALPEDLRADALARVRRDPKPSTRRLHLADFADLLTDNEREDLFENPWNDYTRENESSIVDHLQVIADLLPALSPAHRRRALDRALALPTGYHRSGALIELLPALDGALREEALVALEAVTANEGLWARGGVSDVPFSVEAIERLLASGPVLQARVLRGELVAALLDCADEATIDRALAPLFATLPALEAWDRQDALVSLAPWFAPLSSWVLRVYAP